MYNISRHLHHAEKVFLAMGYRQTDKKEKKESQDLVYDGDVSNAKVLETATDLLVMHEEVIHLKEKVSRLLRSGMGYGSLAQTVAQRQIEFTQARQRDGQLGPQQPSYPTPAVTSGVSSTMFTNTNLPKKVPVSMQGQMEAHENFHHKQQQFAMAQKKTEPDYANLIIGPGGPQVANEQPIASNPVFLPGQAPPTNTSHWVDGSGQLHHPPHGQQQFSQQTQSSSSYQYPPPTTAYRQFHPNHIPQDPHFTHPPIGHAEAQSTAAADETHYHNLADLHLHQPPGPPQQQHSHLCHQQPAVPPPGGVLGVRRASYPTTYQNYPPSTSTSHTADWDGNQADPNNPTAFMNYPPPGAVATDTNPFSAAQVPGHSAAFSHAPHQFPTSPAVSQASGPPSPATTTRPVPKPRSNLPLTPTSQDDPEKLENQNIHRQVMEGGQPSQPSPGSQDFDIENLPPPITNFTTPLEDTSSFESGIKSGLISGFPNPTGGGGYVSFSFPRDSGPQGLGDSQPPLPLEQTSASSSAMSQGTTASSESLDLYGSGTCLQQKGRQFSSQMSKQLSFQAVQEEEEEEEEEKGEMDEGGLHMTTTPTSPPPTIMTQGSMDNVPRELTTEPESSSLQKKSYSKSHSMDMVEGDRPHQERSKQPLRHIQSGSNLPAMEGRSFQRDPVKKLEKPQPTPRRSRSPSPTGSGEPSPSASPKLAPRHQATHEPWTPTGQNRPFPPPDASPKWQTLPRQAQSVEVEPLSNKVMPRFSSGSDLLRNKAASKHLEFKPPAARREYEPDTPVIGLLPPHLKKLQSQSAASTQPVKPQTPPGGSEPPPHQSHTLPQNNCSEHIVKEKELQERLQQEQQQRMELERQLKQLQQQQQQQELQRQLQQQQEKEETQKRLRDLELKLEQQQHHQKKESHSKPPFLSQQQKSVAVVSPTNAQATATLSKPDESPLEFVGGAQALRAQQYPREGASQQSSGEMRERANADASRYRPKRPPTDKPTHKPPEQETSFTDPLTRDSGGVGTSKMPDIATHIDLEDTWVCAYCTNLNSDSLPNCEVCKRPDPRTWVCHRCQNHNPRSLLQCQGCRHPQETTV